MTRHLNARHRWLFCLAALALWLAIGWPVIDTLNAGGSIRGDVVPALWLAPYAIFGAAMMAAMTLELKPARWWALAAVQFAAVAAMVVLVNWSMMAMLLAIVALQVGLALPPLKAFALVLGQALSINILLALVPNPDLCWVNWMAFGTQLSGLITATALRREAETAQALAKAQAVIASNARDAERLRISRELHDAWGHELTALGLQLEIASHVDNLGKASEPVLKARGLASDLLCKVRDVVSTLREADRCDLEAALKALAQRVPAPAVHVDVAPGLEVSPDQAHALMRCAQEAVTNAVRHSQAANLWLQVTTDAEGLRLVARDDGVSATAESTSGSGLIGMRERIELLGGKLAVRTGVNSGFTVDAWLPSGAPQPA